MSWRPLVEVLPVVGPSAAPSEQAEPAVAGLLGLPAGGGDQAPLGYGRQAGQATQGPSPAGAAGPEGGLLTDPLTPARLGALPAAGPPGSPPAPPPGREPPGQAPLFGNASAHAEAAERLREQAKQQGYDEGAALARAEQEALGLRYRGAIEDLVLARDQTVQACEADLVRLALAIAREVLQSDVAGREQYAASMAHYVLQQLGGQDTVTLRLHPRDAAALREHKPELLARPDVQVIEDEALELGGVVAQGGRGRIDASIEGRLAEMRAQLLEAAHGPAA